MLLDRGFWEFIAAVLAVVAVVVGFMRWLYGGVAKQVKKIDQLDVTVQRLDNSLKNLEPVVLRLEPQLVKFGESLESLTSRVGTAIDDIDKRLKDGDKRFQVTELEQEKAKRALTESMQVAAAETRKYHDQVMEEFVRKEELEANIVMVASRFCKDNCRDRR